MRWATIPTSSSPKVPYPLWRRRVSIARRASVLLNGTGSRDPSTEKKPGKRSLLACWCQSRTVTRASVALPAARMRDAYSFAEARLAPTRGSSSAARVFLASLSRLASRCSFRLCSSCGTTTKKITEKAAAVIRKKISASV